MLKPGSRFSSKTPAPGIEPGSPKGPVFKTGAIPLCDAGSLTLNPSKAFMGLVGPSAMRADIKGEKKKGF